MQIWQLLRISFHLWSLAFKLSKIKQHLIKFVALKWKIKTYLTMMCHWSWSYLVSSAEFEDPSVTNFELHVRNWQLFLQNDSLLFDGSVADNHSFYRLDVWQFSLSFWCIFTIFTRHKHDSNVFKMCTYSPFAPWTRQTVALPIKDILLLCLLCVSSPFCWSYLPF